MRTTIAIALALATIAGVAAPTFAASSMMSGSMMAGKSMSMMMKPGETMMMMPNGQTMMMPAMKGPMDAGMMAAAKPMDTCMMFMMGKDGKMYMVSDMKMADGKMACAEMSKMK